MRRPTAQVNSQVLDMFGDGVRTKEGATPRSVHLRLVSVVVAFMGRARRPALGDAGPTDCCIGEVKTEADQRDRKAQNSRAS
jgi:hypothetical protein